MVTDDGCRERERRDPRRVPGFGLGYWVLAQCPRKAGRVGWKGDGSGLGHVSAEHVAFGAGGLCVWFDMEQFTQGDV